jgi:hypothetical protein
MSSPDDDYFLNEDVERNIKIIEKIQIFTASISMISTLTVVFILLYRYQKLVSNRRFVHYILMIAIAGMLIFQYFKDI